MMQNWLGKMLILALLVSYSNAQALALRPMVIEQRRCDMELKKTLYNLAKKHHLKLLITGGGPIIDSNRARWSVSYMSNQTLTTDQVRPIITDMAKEVYHLVTTDPKFLNEENLLHEEYDEPLVSQIFPDRIGIKITFWDQNMDRMKQPAIAQVIFNDKTITYFFADPQTQALVDPIVETLDLTTPNA